MQEILEWFERYQLNNIKNRVKYILENEDIDFKEKYMALKSDGKSIKLPPKKYRESEENNETWNGDQDCPTATESYKEGSTKDHDWGEDYNSKGEYKPVEDMTQEEMKKELEEMMSDALGME